MFRKTSFIFGMLLAGLISGAVWAQPATPKNAAGPAPVSSVSLGPKEKLSDAERLTKSSAAVAQMRQELKLVLGRLEEARGSKDVVKLNCVNDRLTNIKGLVRICEQADMALQEAVAKRDDQMVEHEYVKVMIARQKVQQLKAEAEQCVGMLAFETGPTEVIVQEPVDLPQNDPTRAVLPPPVASRPPPTSPIY